jgi:hypothetical protein
MLWRRYAVVQHRAVCAQISRLTCKRNQDCGGVVPFLSFIGIGSVENIQLCYSTVLRRTVGPDDGILVRGLIVRQ